MPDAIHFMTLPEPEHFMFMVPHPCRMMEPWPLDCIRMPWDPRVAPASKAGRPCRKILKELWIAHDSAMECASAYEAKLEHGTKEDADNARNAMDMHERKFGELMVELNEKIGENSE